MAATAGRGVLLFNDATLRLIVGTLVRQSGVHQYRSSNPVEITAIAEGSSAGIVVADVGDGKTEEQLRVAVG